MRTRFVSGVFVFLFYSIASLIRTATSNKLPVGEHRNFRKAVLFHSPDWPPLDASTTKLMHVGGSLRELMTSCNGPFGGCGLTAWHRQFEVLKAELQ
jgi:hypothetical protein